MRIARASSLLAFGLSFFCTFTTAGTLDLDATTHRVVPGDFNGDGLSDALLQPLDGSQPGGIFFRDSTGKLSIPGQAWDAKYLGLDWSARASVQLGVGPQGPRLDQWGPVEKMKSFGPFINQGGDVPRGVNTYVDFYKSAAPP